MMTCAECAHSRPALTDVENEPILKCHRYPATIFVFDGEIAQTYPEADEPCGEWRSNTPIDGRLAE
jgi:hypothetical protein